MSWIESKHISKYLVNYNNIVSGNCIYLKCTSLHFSCVKYVPEPEDAELLKCALKIYQKYECYPEAMNLAIQLNDLDLIKEIFKGCTGRLVSYLSAPSSYVFKKVEWLRLTS